MATHQHVITLASLTDEQAKMQVLKQGADNADQICPKHISTHFVWALVLTISCFFTIGPCWALYKSYLIRRLIDTHETNAAMHLSNRVSVVLLISTIIGVIAWVALLFCSVGLLLTGKLLELNFI
jgi:heme/copper-type cytochrome/quinol oxidase subunit 2